MQTQSCKACLRARNISNKKIEPNADISPTVRADAPDGDQDEGSIGSTKEDNDVLDQIIKRHEEERDDLINAVSYTHLTLPTKRIV